MIEITGVSLISVIIWFVLFLVSYSGICWKKAQMDKLNSENVFISEDMLTTYKLFKWLSKYYPILYVIIIIAWFLI